jgi:hypothetical protein
MKGASLAQRVSQSETAELVSTGNRCSTAPMRERPLSLHKLQVYLIFTAIEAVDFGQRVVEITTVPFLR